MHQQRFTIDHLLQRQQLADRVPFHLSPDGRWLAITVQDVNRRRPTGEIGRAADGVSPDLDGSRIVIVDTATGAAREPFPAASTSWAPQWSPDGRRLAAYLRHEGPACLAIWDAQSGAFHALRQACVSSYYGFEGPQWLPDNRNIVTKLRPEETPAGAPSGAGSSKPEAASVLVLSFDPVAAAELSGTPEGVGGYAHWQGDLALVDVDSGAMRRLARGWKFSSFRVAPDGHAVAVFRIVADDEDRVDDCFDLVSVALADGGVRQLSPRIHQEYGYCFNWSPDSRWIAYFDLELGQPSRLFVAPGDGAEPPRRLAGDEEMSIPPEEYYLAPRWSADSQVIHCLWGAIWSFAADGSARRKIELPSGHRARCWLQHHPTTPALCTLDGRTVLVTTRDPATKKEGLARIDLETGDGELLAESDHVTGVDAPFRSELAPDGSAAYLTADSADHPAQIWQVAGDFRDRKPLLSWKPQAHRPRLGSRRLIQYSTVASSGALRQAILWLPPDYEEGQRLPVIVDLYPGVRLSTFVHAGGFCSSLVSNPHLLNSRGYAVLHPDVLVHGRDMLRQLAGEVVPAVNHLVDLGIADPKRIGLFGHSRGGHAALGLVTQTDLFCAAVVSAGKLTLTSYGTSGADYFQCEKGIYACGGTLWERREAYLENSPLFYLDRVRTPLLVICGTAEREEEMQARQTFGALRRLGKRVELRLYRDEDHDPGAWTERILRDVVERILGWFDTFARA